MNSYENTINEGCVLYTVYNLILLSILQVLENSNMLLNYARDCGFIIIHVPIAFSDHSEISDNPYGILAGVKDGSAFTAGEWGSDFSG